MQPFFSEKQPPRGAEAFESNGTLLLRWPARTVELRLALTGARGVLGLVLGGVLAPHAPKDISVVTSLVGGLVSGLALSGIAAMAAFHRARVVMLVTKHQVRLGLEGLVPWPEWKLVRAALRDILVVQEQVGTNEGRPIMGWRLVAPRRAGGRTVLVRRLSRPEFGHWVEACYAEWCRLGR